MLYAGGKHHSLFRTAEQLVGLIDPLVNYVAGNLHSALCCFVLRPFAGHFLGAGHVYLF